MKYYKIIFLGILALLSKYSHSQFAVEPIATNPQSGAHNYFGVKVTLDTIYSENVTVEGYIYDLGSFNTNTPFLVTVTAGNLSNQTALNFYETDATAEAATIIATITTLYAGKTIVYNAEECILNFASEEDLLAVINQLNADMESYNAAYEALHSDLDEDELDDLDDQNGFDEAAVLKQFESLFGGFCSKRAQLEALEATWLDNDFGGLNPDSLDFTYDDGWNTVFNHSYLLKVNGAVYALSDTGMFIDNVYQDGITRAPTRSGSIWASNEQLPDKSGGGGPNPPFTAFFCNDCKTNKHSFEDPKPVGNTGWYAGQKIRIFCYGFYQGVRGKVVFYKEKNNQKKKARKEFGMAAGGIVWTNTICTELLEDPYRVDQNPNTWGQYKKRRSLKADFYGPLILGGVWRVHVFDAEVRYNGSGIPNGILSLTW